MSCTICHQTMVQGNLLVFRKPRVVQFLIISILMVLSVGALGFSFRAHADGTTQGVGSLTPALRGPLIATHPFTHDIENSSRIVNGNVLTNYLRLTEYAWALDPLEETDPSNDYYIIFVSTAIQAR